MKVCVRTQTDIPWMPQPGIGRLYITDELPPRERCSTAFGLVFADDHILLTRLHKRGWDIPGGRIEPEETVEAAAIREIWEETAAKVTIVELVGIQELETFAPKPPQYRWPYPISAQVVYLCRLVELCPFEANAESVERRLFPPEEARQVPTMQNHRELYEEALRRVTAQR